MTWSERYRTSPIRISESQYRIKMVSEPTQFIGEDSQKRTYILPFLL